MQHILKDTAKKLESIFVQTVDTSELCYHHLFETFQNDVLLLDADVGAIPNVNNPNGLLTFSKLNKNPSQDLAMLSAGQQTTSEDRLFLFNFDPDPTEKREDINLPGIDQLPAIVDDQGQGIRGRDDMANLIHTLAKLHVKNPKFTLTDWMMFAQSLPALIDYRQGAELFKEAVQRKLKIRDIVVEKAKSGQLEYIDGSRLVTVEEVKAAFIKLRWLSG